MREGIDLSQPVWDASGPDYRYPGQGEWREVGPHLAVARIDGGYVLRHPCLTGGRERILHAVRIVGWTVVQEEPLTLHPSIHCLGCDLHGWVRNGRWEDCGAGLAWTPEP